MQIKEKKRKAQKAKLCVKRERRSAKGKEEAQKGKKKRKMERRSAKGEEIDV